MTVRPVLVVPTSCEPKAMLAGSTDRTGTGGSDPAPESAMVLGLPEALSEIWIEPVRLPGRSGVKVTENVQDAPAASDVPQVVEDEKSPAAAAICVMASVAVPVFVIVTVCGEEDVPRVCAGNESDDGDRETAGTGSASPVPLRDTTSGLVEALLAIDSCPERSPAALGMNLTATEQDTPGASVDGQEDACVKSPVAEMPPTAKTRSARPALVIVTACASEVVPTSCLPKVSEPGDRVTRGTFEEVTFNAAVAPTAFVTFEPATCPEIDPTSTDTANSPTAAEVTSTDTLQPPVVGKVIAPTEKEPAPGVAETAPEHGAESDALAGEATTRPPSDCEKPDSAIGLAFGLDRAMLTVAVLSCRIAAGEMETDTDAPAALPPPTSGTVRGLPAALSAIVIAPLRVPAAVGVNVTLIVHELPAATELPQLFDCEKSPEAAIEVIDSAALPVLDKVTD